MTRRIVLAALRMAVDARQPEEGFIHYRTRDEARADLFEYICADLFEYIKVFYKRKRRHGELGNISRDDFEKQSTGFF